MEIRIFTINLFSSITKAYFLGTSIPPTWILWELTYVWSDWRTLLWAANVSSSAGNSETDRDLLQSHCMLVNPYRLSWQMRLFMFSVWKTLTGPFLPSLNISSLMTTQFPPWLHQLILNWSLATSCGVSVESWGDAGFVLLRRNVREACGLFFIWKISESFSSFIHAAAASQIVPSYPAGKDEEKGSLRTQPAFLALKQKTLLIQVAKF